MSIDLKNYLYSILFPVRCFGCQKNSYLICPDCLNKIPIAKQPIIFKNNNLSALMTTDNQKNILLHKLIYAYKYNRIKELVEPLGKILSFSAQNLIRYYNFEDYDNIILIPVPLHYRRLKWRGFNQAELLADEIGKRLKIPVNNMILRRAKNTKPQMGIENKKERGKNIKNAFEQTPFSKENIKDKIVILVDDISTTGFTLFECASVIKSLKPKKILGLVLAKG